VEIKVEIQARDAKVDMGFKRWESVCTVSDDGSALSMSDGFVVPVPSRGVKPSEQLKVCPSD
jgi:hypothetical protein